MPWLKTLFRSKPRVVACLSYPLGLLMLTAVAPRPALAQQRRPEPSAAAQEMLHGVLKGPKGYFVEMVFSPDGRLAAAGLMQSDSVFLFDVATRKGKVRLQMPNTNYSYRLAFAPDGATLVVSGREDDMIRTFHVATGRQVREVKKPDRDFFAFAPGGKQMVLGNLRGPNRSVGLYDTATGKLVRRFARAEFPCCCAFSPDGRILATYGNWGEVQLWDVQTGRLVGVPVPKDRYAGNATLTVLAFSPDGTLLASAGHKFGEMSIVAVASGKVRLHLRSKGIGNPPAFSPDGSLLVTSFQEGLVLHDLLNGKELWHLRPPVPGQFVAFSPDGSLLAVAGQTAQGEAAITLYDMPHGRHEPLPHKLSSEQLETFWGDLTVENDFRLQRVLAGLRSAPTSTVPFLAKKLKPVSEAQRKHILGLLRDLDDEDATKRDQAMEALQKEAAAFEPLLADRRRTAEPGDVRNRIARILNRERTSAVPRTLLNELRAVAILEQIGSPSARSVLRTLACGAAGARLTVEAQQALDRLGPSRC
jgi:hypothetical protein